MDKKIQNNAYMAESKKRLSKIITKKHKTTMIGALDRIETFLGFLWGEKKHEDLSDDIILDDAQDIINIIQDIQKELKGTDCEVHFKLLWQLLRAAILNLGNNNIRDSEKEIEMYDITWKKYTLNLPVINRRRTDGQENV